MNDALLKEERQQFIWELLQKDGKVTVTELSQRFSTSEVTIRRDLAELADQGKLVRSHRGALVVATAPPEPPVVHRMEASKEAKEQIGRVASALVAEGDSVFLGSGSTTALLARMLAERKNLTVVTNSIGIAYEFAANESSANVVVTGGVLRNSELALQGYLAELALKELHVTKVIMGAQALSLERGWTTDYLQEIVMTRRIIDMAPELIILADHTKLGKTAAGVIVPLERISALVTDPESEPEFLAAAEALGLKVILSG
jgi:DeoR/GlpR family transcriptional regulator of sugar metabolism